MKSDLDLVKAALEEDLPAGDITTDSLGLEQGICGAKIIAKEKLVLSGSQIATLVFHTLDSQIQCHWHFADGAMIPQGETVLSLRGPKRQILKGERTALNFLGRLSGVATLTRTYVEALEGTAAQILDTRKTTPLLRRLEKQAVVHGGGTNHRHSLSDRVLIKENHIRAAGGIRPAIQSIRKQLGPTFIEIEVTNLMELSQALDLGVDCVLLDNMSNQDMSAAVNLVGKKAKTEASGNMTLDRIRQVAQIGVDYISVGRITHSARCVDFSLLFDE